MGQTSPPDVAVPNSADKSLTLNQESESSLSDPELDELGFSIPEFRVPTSQIPAITRESVEAARLAQEDLEATTRRTPVDERPIRQEIEEPTHNVSVDDLLRADADAAFADDGADRFDRAELVKTVRMDAFDREQVESGTHQRLWEISGYLDDQRYAPDVLVAPPRVLTRRWQDGAQIKPNGVSQPAGQKAVEPTPAAEHVAQPASINPAQSQPVQPAAVEVRSAPEAIERPSPATTSGEFDIELDSEAIEFEDLQHDVRPPPKPALDEISQPSVVRQRPGREPRTTGPMQRTESVSPPQAQPDDDDMSGIVQELLEEKKAKPDKAAKPTPKRDERRVEWFKDVFSEEYFRTLPKELHKETERDVKFIHQSLGLQKGARLLDLACGFGRHAVELAQRDYEIAGLDASMPMLQRALAEAQRRGLSIKFVHGDMRELNFNGIFDACFCWQTSFGYFDDRTNVQIAQGVARALKPGGRFLLDVVNRDHIVAEMPARTWWEGKECVFLEEVEFDNHYSVLHTKRSFIYENGAPPREFSSYIRLYSLHELRQLLHFAGFRLLEVSGEVHHRGSFLGPASPRIIVLAERMAPAQKAPAADEK